MKEFDDYIEEVRSARRLDARSSLLDVRIEKRGSRLVIVGITTVPDAITDIIARLTELKSRRYIKDEVVRLPDESVGADRHAVIRAALAPVYGDPALPAPQITQAVLGVRVDPLTRANAWTRIRLEDGYIGWVHTGYLQFGSSDWAHAWERNTHGEPVVSLGAELLDDEARVFARLPWGSRIVRLGPNLYELPDGRRGSIGSGEVVDVDRLADWFPARGDSVVRTARRWMGAPYLWGGVTTGGVDCSGLVQAVFWLHGIALPRDSDQQSRSGERIDAAEDFSNLLPGDLVFFSESGTRVSHVAISMGGPQIVHSALTNGGVDVNDLSGDRDLEIRLRGLFTNVQRVLPD
jgi:gamma-D-glutamyl-L-lysine dipeptidyl-peptidase